MSKIPPAGRRLLFAAVLLVLAGPAAAQWVPTGGPPGGRFNTLAAPDGALLGAHSFAALRYAGGVWESAPAGLGEMVAGGSRVLARTADGLVLSTDAGATFAPVPVGEPSWRPLPIDGSTLFTVGLGADDSLRVSADDGATWAAVQDSIWVRVTFGSGSSSFPVPLNSMVGALADGDAVLVAGTAYVFGGVYRHTPGDTAWVPLLQPGAPAISEAVQPYALVRHGGAIWFAHSGGIHRSPDGGATWIAATFGLPASPAGFDLYVGAVGLVARSRASGALSRWTDVGWTAVPAPPAPILELASGDALYAATTDRVYAFDGTAWSALPAVVASSPVPVASDASGALVVASGGQLLRSTDGAASWTTVLSGSVGPYAVTPGRIVAATTAGLRRSLDGGVTWTAAAQPPIPPSATTTRPNALVAHGDALFALHGYTRIGKHGVLLEQYGGVFRSLDGGTTWADVSAGLPASSLGRLPVAAGVSFPGAVFAVTSAGCVRLPDDATAWAAAACPSGSIRDVAEVGSARVVRTSMGLSVSSDGGASWTALVAGLPVPAGPVAAAAFWNGAQFARTAAGLLLVADPGDGFRAYRLDGAAWTETATTFPDGVAWGGFLETAGATLYGGSLGRGLWRADGSVSIEGPALPELTLDAPRPNPARGAVRVRFTLPAASEATVAVFDVLGRRVAVLADGPFDAGSHDLDWTPGMAAGTYVVRLTTPGGVRARPVTTVQ